MEEVVSGFEILEHEYYGGKGVPKSASVRLRRPDGTDVHVGKTGVGTVDATFKALMEASGMLERAKRPFKLERWTPQALQDGYSESECLVTVKLRFGPDRGSGEGRDTDTVLASGLAMIAALNDLESKAKVYVVAEEPVPFS